MERPLSRAWCFLGWLIATALFVGLTATFGGPTYGDTPITVLSTWAVAHGDLACAYPPQSTYQFALASPLYPLLSGAVAALFRIGNTVPFPGHLKLGANCYNAFPAISAWANRARAWLPTMRIAYLSWTVLSAGMVTLLRASGRGLRGWEPTALIWLAVTTPIELCLVEWFHPQDVVSVGLALLAIAAVRRNKWTVAGICLGMAYTSQPFAALIASAFVALVPRARRLQFLGSFFAAIALVATPFIVASSGRALRSVLIGSNRVGVANGSLGGTVVWELHLHGWFLFVVSRVLPAGAAFSIAWFLSRSNRDEVLLPNVLIGIVAVSFAFRLVFEENLVGYYLIAVAVTLVALDVVSGRIRGSTLAWIALATAVFSPVPFEVHANGSSSGVGLYEALPLAMLAVVAMIILITSMRKVHHWYLYGWTALMTTSMWLGGWRRSAYGHPFPLWLWQVILVSLAIRLAAGPLVQLWRNHNHGDARVAASPELRK